MSNTKAVLLSVVKGSLNPMELVSLLCTTSQSVSSIWSLLLQPEMGNDKGYSRIVSFLNVGIRGKGIVREA